SEPVRRRSPSIRSETDSSFPTEQAVTGFTRVPLDSCTPLALIFIIQRPAPPYSTPTFTTPPLPNKRPTLCFSRTPCPTRPPPPSRRTHLPAPLPSAQEGTTSAPVSWALLMR